MGSVYSQCKYWLLKGNIMRITENLKLALKAAHRDGITEISVCTGMRFGQIKFVVIPLKSLYHAKTGTDWTPKGGEMLDLPGNRLNQAHRCQLKNVWKYNLKTEPQLEFKL